MKTSEISIHSFTIETLNNNKRINESDTNLALLHINNIHFVKNIYYDKINIKHFYSPNVLDISIINSNIKDFHLKISEENNSQHYYLEFNTNCILNQYFSDKILIKTQKNYQISNKSSQTIIPINDFVLFLFTFEILKQQYNLCLDVYFEYIVLYYKENEIIAKEIYKYYIDDFYIKDNLKDLTTVNVYCKKTIS